MKSYVALIAALMFINSSASAAESITVPPEIAGFISKSYSLIALESADLDGDGLKDYLVVTQEPAVENADSDDEQGSRRLLILTAQKDGKPYKLAASSDKVVLCEQCGGVFGDPFDSIAADKKTFTINHYGGSNWRWSHSYTFNYSRIDKAWQLVDAREESYHTSDPETTDAKTYTPKDFGKIDLKDFDPATYVKRTE